MYTSKNGIFDAHFESVEKVTNSLQRAFVSEPVNMYQLSYSCNTDQPGAFYIYSI
jgi:hypothetical protein